MYNNSNRNVIRCCDSSLSCNTLEQSNVLFLYLILDIGIAAAQANAMLFLGFRPYAAYWRARAVIVHELRMVHDKALVLDIGVEWAFVRRFIAIVVAVGNVRETLCILEDARDVGKLGHRFFAGCGGGVHPVCTCGRAERIMESQLEDEHAIPRVAYQYRGFASL